MKYVNYYYNFMFLAIYPKFSEQKLKGRL